MWRSLRALAAPAILEAAFCGMWGVHRGNIGNRCKQRLSVFRHHAADTLILSCNLPRLSFFVTKKGNEKVPLLRGSALGGQNDGCHPAELARSCGSKPRWGFDRCATPQPRLRGYSPLRTPKLWSSSKKAKKCRSAAFFLTLFHRPPY